MKNTKRYVPYAAGVLVAVIFGFSFMFTKNALDIMSPMQILAYRFTTAALILNLLRIIGIISIDLNGKKSISLVVLALFQPIAYFICETMGVKLTSSSEAGMMIALIPVVVTIFAAFVLKEKPSAIQVIFIIISVSGVMLIILAKGVSSINPNYTGIVVLLGAVLAAGVYNILSRKLSVRFTPVEITYVMMCTGAIIFFTLALLQQIIVGNVKEFFTPLFNAKSWVPILYLGVLSSVTAFFMVNYMLSQIAASQAAVFNNLTTIISIIAGVFIKGESFYWYQGVGGALILIGVWGTNYYAGRTQSVIRSGEIENGVSGEVL